MDLETSYFIDKIINFYDFVDKNVCERVLIKKIW